MGLQLVEIPKLRKRRGKEAIKGLHGFIAELEGYNDERLTIKQTDALIRVARELISAIETNGNAGTLGELNEPIHTEAFSYPSFTDSAREQARACVLSLAPKLT